MLSIFLPRPQEVTSGVVNTRSEAVPAAVGTEHLIGDKPRLVDHRLRAGDVVSEINVRNAPAGGMLDDLEDVESAQGAAPFRRIVVEVHRRQPAGQVVNVA